ncbi:hypothetical protein PIB30_023520 [Stylosanthes scabra]|uniref:Uncharacterized protein n=1 Tax=Stylosanthes scabra TaxID=79078 RepID=A0ABU6U9Z1_9FABA|nr:hypothetical protein [Stylosanthes scabra]
MSSPSLCSKVEVPLESLSPRIGCYLSTSNGSYKTYADIGTLDETYPPCRHRIPHVPRKSTTPPSYSPLSRSWMDESDIEMKEDKEKEESEPEEYPEEDPAKDQERLKEESELKSMGANTESEFIRFLESGQPMSSSFGSYLSITSRNPDQTSRSSSGTRSIES